MIIKGSNYSLNNLDILNRSQNTLSKQMSSGSRVFSASVDPAASAVISKLNSKLNEYDQNIQNYQMESNSLSTKEGGLNSIGDDLQSIRKLQVQYKNDTLTDDEKDAIQQQADALVTSISNSVDQTEFNEKKVIEPGEKLSNLIENGIDLNQSLDDTQNIMDEVSGMRSSVGSEMNSLDNKINDTSIAFENTLAAYSSINDMDVAKGVSDNTKDKILEQANLMGLGSIMSLDKNAVSALLG